jgi:uroporphyrinogen-III synthase
MYNLLNTGLSQISHDIISEQKEFIVCQYPVITIEAVSLSIGDLAEVLAASELLFFSKTGVRTFVEQLKVFHIPLDRFSLNNLYAIGQNTADELSLHGLDPINLNASSGLDFAEKWLAVASSKRAMLLGPEKYNSEVDDYLKNKDINVQRCTLYKTLVDKSGISDINLASQTRPFEWVLFTSPSTVDCYVSHIKTLQNAKFASIGPLTSAACAKHGLKVSLEASERSVTKLFQLIIDHIA